MVKTMVKTMDSLHSSSENWNPKKASSAWGPRQCRWRMASMASGRGKQLAAIGTGQVRGALTRFFLGDGLTRALTLW